MEGREKNDDGTFAPRAYLRRPIVHYLRRHVTQTLAESNCVVSEIWPRFGKMAGGFIFLPFVLVVYEHACVCVCVCALPLSRIKEKRGSDGALLSVLCSTEFLLERGKDASCLKPGTLFEHSVLSSPSIFLLRRGTSNDTLK